LITKNNGKKIIALMSLVLATVIHDNLKLMMLLIPVFQQFKIVMENVAKTHEQFFEYLNKKVKTFEQGIKTYTKYSQAKELFDKLGIALNESIVNEQSSNGIVSIQSK
jgi:hypothetical protein